MFKKYKVFNQFDTRQSSQWSVLFSFMGMTQVKGVRGISSLANIISK